MVANVGPVCLATITTKAAGVALLETVESDEDLATYVPAAAPPGMSSLLPPGAPNQPVTLTPGRTV